MVVTQDSKQSITVSQIDERCYDRNVEYEYSNARFIVIKEDGLEYVGGSMKCNRDVWKEFPTLEQGDYFIFVEIDWNPSTQHTDFTLSAYGQSPVHFVRDEKTEHSKPQLLEQVYKSCAPIHGKRTTYEQHGLPDAEKFFQLCEEGYGYVYIRNDSEESSLKETVTYTKFDGLELQPPFKG